MTDTGEAKLHFLDYWRVIRVRWGIITLVFLLVLITAGVTTYFLPRQYLAQTSLIVQPDNAGAIDIFERGGRTAADATFTATQFQVIQRKSVLYPAVEKLDLEKKWAEGSQPLSKERAAARLRRMMDLRDIRNTAIVEIGIYSTDREEAALFANTIADVYVETRLADQKESTDTTLGAVGDEIDEQRKKVEAAAAEATKIRTEQGIIDPSPESMDEGGGMDYSQVQSAQAALNQQEIQVTSLRSRLAQIEKLTPEEVIRSRIFIEINDATIEKIVPLLQDAEAEVAGLLKSGLGVEHPQVQALRAQMEIYRKTLSDQVQSLRSSLESQLTIATKTQKALEDQLQQTKDAYAEGRSTSGAYIEAKSKYLRERGILEALTTKLRTERVRERVILGDPAKILERAEPPSGYAKPNVPAYMALAVLVGLILGVGLAFFIEYLDTSVKTLDDVERFLGIPVLAVIPKNVPLLIKQTGDSPDAEAYRILRTNIEFNRKDPDANTVTVISGGPGEGKSTTLNNLAFTCAQSGYRVLVVDTDLRRPAQHRFFDVDNSVGLTNYLTSTMSLEEVMLQTQVENLSFIPSGTLPSDAVGILNSQRMADLILRVKRSFDLVFFDSPPVLGVSDGSVLASEVDITVMVVQHRRFPRSMLQRVKQTVLNVGGNLLGVVLNNVDTRHDQGYQYYTQYYDYYTHRQDSDPVIPRPSAASPGVSTPVSTSSREDY